jgi:hypothetical protein
LSSPAKETRPESHVSACPGGETQVEATGQEGEPTGEVPQLLIPDVIDLGHAPEPPAVLTAANQPVPSPDAPTPRPRRKRR